MKVLKNSVKTVLKTILETTKDDFQATLPTWCDVVKISAENETIEFLTIDEFQDNPTLSKVLKLKNKQSTVIGDDIYIMLIDITALDDK